MPNAEITNVPENNKPINQQYIEKCAAMIKCLEDGGSPKEGRQLIDTIIQIFQTEIRNIESGISGYGLYNDIDESACKKELEILKGKLHLLEAHKATSAGDRLIYIDDPSPNVNTMNIAALFADTKKAVRENGSLSAAETKEILDKIKTLEKIQNSESDKKKKWEKLRGTMEWLSKKGVAVAIPIFNIIWRMMND